VKRIVIALVSVGNPDEEYAEHFAFFRDLSEIKPMLSWYAQPHVWDNIFRTGGTSPDYDTAVAALTGRPAPKRDWTDVASAWVIDVIGGRAGDGLDRFLDNTDAFAAGVSSTVTGGLSDKVRAGIYGDITDQSDNGWYTAGQVVGIAPAFATGLATGGTGALAIASKAFTAIDTAHGFYESGSKFANGEPLHWTDYTSFLPLGGAVTSKFASRFKGAITPNTGVLSDAAKSGGRVVGEFKISLQNPPPSGWRYWVTPYKPKFVNPRIVDPTTGTNVPLSQLGTRINLHELQHFADATGHPELYYIARVSKVPGSGLAHYVFETRGYLQSHGLSALFRPDYVMASVNQAGRGGLVYRDLIGAGLLGSGIAAYWGLSDGD
jgi:hypothetical protein